MDNFLSDLEFKDLRRLVFDLAGITMGENKRQLLKSRLQRRLRALGIETFTEYLLRLKNSGPDDPEREAFVNAVTTNKTDFFREPHHFSFVINRVIPDLLADGQSSLRVWHAGCSTGEEPYTMAMALLEADLPGDFQFRQLASDIDTGVLAHAEAGTYAEERIETIPTPLLKRWFLKGKGPNEGLYRVRPDLQENLTFRQINLVQPPWPMKSSTVFDVIFCRNVMIYFSRETQGQLISDLVARLRPGGYLMLGHSESLHNNSDGLENVGHTIYRKPVGEMSGKRVA